MAQVIFDDPVKSLKGKICKHKNTIYKEMRGTNFTSQICNPRDMSLLPYSDEELGRQDLFRQAQAAANAINSDPTQRKAAVRRFIEQRNNGGMYKSLLGFLVAEQYAILKAEAEGSGSGSGE